MTIRTKRRLQGGNKLEKMSDSDLSQIYFFGDIHSDPFTVTYQATKEDQARALAILKEREKR